MAAPVFDLQSHSTWSDGSLRPAEVVRLAREAGVELLALTDHDTVDGVDEALAAAEREGLRLVPATELSALDGDREDLHVLGYGIDHRDPALRTALHRWREDRAARGVRMAAAMAELGWAVELPDRGDKPLGRPHLAQAIFDHPDNRMRLQCEGLVNFSQLLEAYLVPGRPGYRRRSVPDVTEAIAVVHAAGGVAVWAHPFWDLAADADVLEAIDRFSALGLDGVEAFYITHTEHQTRLVARRCTQLGLLRTGSADFHGPDHVRFNRFRAFSLYGCGPALGPIA
ncbi:MAG TPA: PHP domain-containing protein [Solirubrobacteraceae bacterium]|nr:PHP domain-containing protein [Solirubrobacteraceae bacterium]